MAENDFLTAGRVELEIPADRVRASVEAPPIPDMDFVGVALIGVAGRCGAPEPADDIEVVLAAGVDRRDLHQLVVDEDDLADLVGRVQGVVDLDVGLARVNAAFQVFAVSE